MIRPQPVFQRTCQQRDGAREQLVVGPWGQQALDRQCECLPSAREARRDEVGVFVVRVVVVAAGVVPALYYVGIGVAALFGGASSEATPPPGLSTGGAVTLALGLNGFTTLVLVVV